MSSRAISVKVPTAKVINALETKLANVQETFSNQDKLEAEYQAECDAWKESLIKFALDNISKGTNFRTNYASWSNKLNIDFDINTEGVDFPGEPKRNFEQMNQWVYNAIVEEIQNALNILKMTDEETVNASTFKTIAKYL
jgi:hypothetical protein